MGISELLEFIEKGEDSQTQFKERFESIDALAAEICAFSNSNGGNIIVGVSDDGGITGLEKDDILKFDEWVSGTCSQKIDPQVNVTTQNIKYHDKIVMVISVPMGSNKFYMANGKDTRVKLGADKRRAKREENLMSNLKLMADDKLTLANTKSGIIFIGVSNKYNIKGIKVEKETLNQWTNQISRSTGPRIIPELEEIKIDGVAVNYAKFEGLMGKI